MSTIDPNYDFEINQDGDVYVVNYKKARQGLAVGCFFVVINISIALLLSVIIPINSYSFIIWLPLTFVILWYFGNKKRRTPGEFRISKDFYQIGESKYDRAHVSNLQVGNSMDKGLSSDGTIIVAQGVVGGMAAASNDFGRIYRHSKRKASYKISFLYGTKQVDLAFPLGENQAITLYNKVIGL